MAQPVEITDVAQGVAEFGPLATLVTVTEGGAPHVGSVLVAVDDGHLAVSVGSRTRANIRSNHAVTLAWLPDHADYQLIVDGNAVTSDEPTDDGLFAVRIDVERGILHRVAGRTEAGPSCVPLTHRSTA